MSSDTPTTAAHTKGATDSTPMSGRWPLAAVVVPLVTFASAWLLFTIEPMFARIVLPKLGGSPQVWAVALFFFEAALFVGYAYAHALIRFLPLRLTGIVHAAVLLGAFVCLPIGLPGYLDEPPIGDPTWWQLEVFGLAIGLPFAALAANAPLFQAWYARLGKPGADGRDPDPYFLYAASNLGSLLALLSYPLALEPAFGLGELKIGWSVGFVLLTAAIAALAFKVKALPAVLEGAPESPVPDFREAKIHISRALQWVALAFVPSALLTAFTTHVSTDVATAPLLWVMPLAAYLLSFVLVFTERPLLPPRFVQFVHVLAVLAALLQLSQTKHETWQLTALTGGLAFFTSCLVAHRTLYDQRPHVAQLTTFYLLMALGGGLGGLFSGLVAPKLFSEVLEYPILLALSVACQPGALRLLAGSKRERLQRLLFLGGVVVAWFWVPWAGFRLQFDFYGYGGTFILAACMALLAALSLFAPERQLIAILGLAAAVTLLPSGVKRGEAQRSYFGVYRVLSSEDGDFNILMHGTTLHGAERIRDTTGAYVVDLTPATYYHPKSPMARSIETQRRVLAEKGRKGSFGVVGLGTGSLSCYSKPDETWKFFEIDPVIVRIASDATKFSFLTSCRPKADIVMGDARLTLAKQPDASLDLLIVDAFSSDAVPVHLLTAEALAMYATKLTSDGVLVLHISNRYLDLEGVVGATAPLVPALKGLLLSEDSVDGSYAVSASTVGLFAKSDDVLAHFRDLADPLELDANGMHAWTDDSADILRPLWSRLKPALLESR